MIARPRCTTTLVASLAVLAIMMLCSGRATGGEPEGGRYLGEVSFNPDATVALTVKPRQDLLSRGSFKVRGIEFECEDGTVQVRDLPRIAVRFAGGRLFVGDEVRLHAGVIEMAATVKGRITRRGKAFGELYAFRNPRDASGPDQMPECSTGSVDLWQAARD